MSVILKTLASTYPADAPIAFLSLNAEELPDVSEQYDVTAVPYIVVQKDGKTLETVSGSDAAKVRAAVERYAGAGSGATGSSLPPAQTVTRPPVENGTNGDSTKNLAGYAPSASTYPADAPIAFLSLNAEELPDVSEQYDVTAVPYIVVQKDGKTLETVSGSDAAKVRAAVERYAGAGSGATGSSLPPAQTVTRPPVENGTNGDSTKNLAGYAPSASDPKTAPEYSSGEQETSKEELHKRLSELVKAAPVMLFMKGTPSAPQCGFSRQTVSVLREKGIRYGFFNILADDEVRQGLKEFADWPTFPQLWVDGELVGGLDIVSPHSIRIDRSKHS